MNQLVLLALLCFALHCIAWHFITLCCYVYETVLIMILSYNTLISHQNAKFRMNCCMPAFLHACMPACLPACLHENRDNV